MLPSVSNATTEIFGSYLKFKGQNLGYLSPIILEAKFGALTEFQRQILRPSPRLPNTELLPWSTLPVCNFRAKTVGLI